MILPQPRFDQSGSVAYAYPLVQAFTLRYAGKYTKICAVLHAVSFCLVAWEVPDGCKQSPNFYLRWPGG